MPTRTRRKEDTSLSRERIIEVARRLLEAEGLPGLSMRRLAGELGVSAMTPYRYFQDKDELLDAVVDDLVSQEPIPEPKGNWRARVSQLMHWLRAELDRYPALIGMRMERPFLSPGALRFTEVILDALVKAGFSRADALRIYRTLLIHTFGSAAFGSRADEDEVKQRTAAALAALPVEEFPILSASIAEAAATASEGPFEYGLERLLDGLEAALKER